MIREENRHSLEITTLKSCTFLFILSVLVIRINSVDVEAQKENYRPDYLHYHNLSQLTSDLRDLGQAYPEIIKINFDYKSREGRPQFLLEIFNFSSSLLNRNNAVKVLLTYGEHAREFFPVESLLYFLKNVTKGLDKSSEERKGQLFSRWIVNNFVLYIIALANPDGRHYIEQSQNYCWRGTGNGVDINRNFDWNYGGTGSSNNPRDGEYRGKYAFSEPETLLFKQLGTSKNLDAFISFHSGVRHIYIPFADSKSRVEPPSLVNKEHILRLAKRMANASSSRPFLYGLPYKLTGYTADGTSYDYMAGIHKIPFSLAVEMWQHKHHVGRSCFDEFNPKSEELQEELQLVHPLYVEMLSYLYTWKVDQKLSQKQERFKPEILIRKKKDNSQDDLDRKDFVDLVQDGDTGKPMSSEEQHSNFLVYFLLFLLCVVMAALGLKHGLQMMKRKRIVSLRSLSSTFSFLKTL